MGGDSETRVIVVEEEREAEYVETTDYFFDKIGESVPLTPNHSSFDLQNPPSLPLAVSERFRLIFVAHPSDGFCVAKTADVIKLAKDIKSAASSSSSLLDASIVQVPLGRVSALSLSTDSSTLAASVAGDIHFFSAQSLLAKEKQPRLSLSVDSPNIVKYFSWTKNRDTSFVVLSNTGTLYRGDLQLQQQEQPLKHVMDDVDAVDWSVKGEFLAVARKQIVSILTREFNERKQILLQLKLGFVDASGGALTVDSIQWVRPDCIVLGCLQQSEVGKEENYLVQVITCGNGEEITDASSRPVILCLSDLFLNIIDDIIPSGCGPHLILNYLEKRQLAVLANRKNIDQHIVLVGWLDDNDGPAVIQIERDNWLPRIELQENGDDNVLLGVCIDRASVYENIEVQRGVDDQRDLSPYCIFLCLTHEGKLVIFHFASISGDSCAPCAVPDPAPSAVPSPSEDEEAIFTSGYPDLPTISAEEKNDNKQVVLDLQSRDMNRDEPAATKVDQKYFQKNRETPFTDKSVTSIPDFDQTLTTGRTTGMWTTKGKDQLGPSPLADVGKRLGVGQSWPIGNDHLNQNTLKSFAGDASKIESENFEEAEKRKPVVLRSDSDPVGINNAISSNLSQGEKSKISVEFVNRESRSNQPSLFKDVPKQGTTNLSGSFSSSTIMAINPGRATSVPTNVTLGTQSMQAQGPLLPGKAVSHAVHPITVNPKIPSQSAHSNFELSLSKKYGNMKDMTSELDKLLQCIEEPGGFMDTCRSSQNLLENLEESMMVSCHKCTTWQNLLHEQAESIQHLLDNTVQVLARKIYMEGIVKQTRDKQYWDLWNRQKLSSELQMKRQSMINLSQDLINQLIELEKHFNALELNNYGESKNVNLSCQSSRSKYAPSRRIQSLHAVHNALNSQLAAAEQLSESLSRQMSVLSLTSPSVKPDNVKDQLFKMIGIPCESPPEISSHTQKVMRTATPHVTPLFSSVAATSGNDFKSNQTVASNHEPETARRRRDSFDQNWANFEPSKTTIKRKLRENERPDVQRPSLFMDKRFSISSNAEGSVESCLSGHATQLDMFNDAMGLEDTSKNFLPRSSPRSSRDRDLYEPSASSVNQSSGKQTVDKRILGAISPESSKYSGVLDLHLKKETHQVTTEQPDHRRTNIENPESALLKEKKTGFTVAQSSQDQANFQRAQSPVFPFSKTTNNAMMSYNSKDYTSSKRTGNIVEEQVSRSSPAGSGCYHEAKSSRIHSLSDQPATLAQLGTPTSGIQSSEALSTSSITSFNNFGSKSPFSSSSTATAHKFLSTNGTGSLNSTTDNQNKFRSASQPTRLTFSSAASVTSLNSPSTKSIEKAPSSVASSTDSRVEPLNIEHQSSSGDEVHAGSTLSDVSSSNPVDTRQSKSHEMSASSLFKTLDRENPPFASKVDAGILQKELPTSGLSWSTSTFTGSSDIASTVLASGSHLNSNSSATHGTDVVTNIEAKESSGLFLLSQPHVLTCEDKTADSDFAQEDEMEEEAPDTSQAADLSLGSLGGLGLGSGVSTSSTFRSNPFGAATASTSATVASSTMDMAIPSGQLFRPASLSFQTLQPSQQPQTVNASGFGFGTQTQVPSASSLGQPAQIGSGQQALGSVLGSFGQSRQLGPALQGSNFGGQSGGGFPNAASSSGFSGISAIGGGFATASATGGGFAGLSASGSGFTGVSAPAGGFAGVGATGGGFASLSTPSGGFAGAGAAPGGGFGGGGGFGAFSNQGGGGGFSSFGSGPGGKQPPSQLFTQMRK